MGPEGQLVPVEHPARVVEVGQGQPHRDVRVPPVCGAGARIVVVDERQPPDAGSQATGEDGDEPAAAPPGLRVGPSEGDRLACPSTGEHGGVPQLLGVEHEAAVGVDPRPDHLPPACAHEPVDLPGRARGERLGPGPHAARRLAQSGQRGLGNERSGGGGVGGHAGTEPVTRGERRAARFICGRRCAARP
jgi:hypothetical protein